MMRYAWGWATGLLCVLALCGAWAFATAAKPAAKTTAKATTVATTTTTTTTTTTAAGTTTTTTTTTAAAPTAVASPAVNQTVSLKEQMRLLWPAKAGSAVRTWLVCGEFGIPHDDDEVIRPDELEAGLANDYLHGHGGEAGIRPLLGWTHLRADGSQAPWAKYDARTEQVHFSNALPGRPGFGAVWYAFTSVTRPLGGTAVLRLGSDNTVKVWVNGEPVHTHAVEQENAYTDLVAVPLRAGENAVLVKVAQRTPGGFTFRVLELAQAQVMEDVTPRIAPYIVATDDLHPATLTVATDDGRGNLMLNKIPVAIAVVGPDGKVMATQTVTRGAQARFDCAVWTDGPYEIRLTTTDNNKRRTVYLPWYRGDALAAARQLVETAPDQEDGTPTTAVHRMLAELVQARLGKVWSKITPAMLPVIMPALLEFAELQQFGPEHLPDRQGGLVRLTYRDDFDDSAQFCRVYLPPDYTPRKTYPVIITLHGRDDAFPPYAEWGGVDRQHDAVAEGYHVITVYPHAHGNTWYRGIGDRDVMRCLEMVKAKFSVDDDRVYLLGYSMGGAGVWYVGTRHPEQFAALAPFFGGFDFRFQLENAALDKLTPREQYRRERLSYIAQLEALRTTPVFTSHGDADPIVPVDYSRYTVRLLQRWGYDVRYWEYPDRGHGGLNNEEDVLEWLLAHRRTTNPEHVSVRAAALRSAAAHWVQVTQRKDPYAFINVDAEVLASNYLRLNTENVLEIVLTPPSSLIDLTKPARVLWNNSELLAVPFINGKLVLRARGYQPPALCKRPELEGPANDLYNTPFAVVVGTIAPDPLMRRLCARAAERYVAAWDERFHAKPRVLTDTAITADEQARYSLLLFGGPNENAVARAMRAQLPLTITRHAVIIDGRKFDVRDAAMQMVYPNPSNVDRYVIIRAATSAPAMALTEYVLNDVDFCIVDRNNIDTASAGAYYDAITGRCTGAPILAGYFDHAWRVKDAYWELDRSPRVPPLTTPRYADAATAPGNTLFLADVVESHAEGVFRDLTRNVNAQWKPLTLGNAVLTSGIATAPKYWQGKKDNAVEYDLTGGNWHWLRASIGLEVDPSKEAAAAVKLAPIHLEFVVKGDGVELYHSTPFGYTTPAKSIEVDITGVQILSLEILNKGAGTAQAKSVDWGKVRLER